MASLPQLGREREWVNNIKTLRITPTIQKKRLQNVASFHQTLNFSINYLAALAVSKTTEKASGSLTAKSANIFLFTVMLAFLQALTNLE